MILFLAANVSEKESCFPQNEEIFLFKFHFWDNISECTDKFPTPVSDSSSDDISNVGHLFLVHITPLSTINLHPLLLQFLDRFRHQSGLPT